MSSPSDKDRPEAGGDTDPGKRGEGAHARDGDSGGKPSKAGSGDALERVAEANRNKSFDTTHVHTSGSSRKV